MVCNMGCIICNMLNRMSAVNKNDEEFKQLIKQEICNDIATYHEEMVKEINKIHNKRKGIKKYENDSDDKRNC